MTTLVIARITNSLIKALNSSVHLPQCVIMILDKDIIEALDNKGYGAKSSIEDCLYWVIKQISRALLTRCEDLKAKSPGSVTPELTRVIWVKMLTRPFSEDITLKKIWKLCPKFNNALDSFLAIENYMHVITTAHMEEFKHFDTRGNLTNSGKRAFWRSINQELQSLDWQLAEKQQNKSEEPKQYTTPPKINQRNGRSRSSEDTRRPTKLPTPPPYRRH